LQSGEFWNAFCSAPFGFKPFNVLAVDFVWLTAFWISLPISDHENADRRRPDRRSWHRGREPG
jgi:hypothetical protein